MELGSLFMFSSTQCTASLSFYQDPLTLLMKCEQIDSPKPQPKWAFTLWCSQTACETFQLMLRCPLGILQGVQEIFFFSFFLFLFLYHDVLLYSGRTKSHHGKYELAIKARVKTKKNPNFYNFSKSDLSLTAVNLGLFKSLVHVWEGGEETFQRVKSFLTMQFEQFTSDLHCYKWDQIQSYLIDQQDTCQYYQIIVSFVTVLNICW